MESAPPEEEKRLYVYQNKLNCAAGVVLRPEKMLK